MAPRKSPARIIVTRPVPDAAAFAALARAAGAAPIVSPVITITYSAGAPDMSGVGALAFTSANGVRAFIAAAGQAVALPVFTVGAATAEEAGRAGFARITAASGDVESLTREIVAAWKAGEFAGSVLHVAGSDRAGDLVGALQSIGVDANIALLYRAEPARTLASEAMAALTSSPPAESVALFSPRSARIFIELVRDAGLEPRLREVTAGCFSKAVAEAAAAVSWRKIVVAEQRSSENLLSMLLAEIDRTSG